MTTFTYIVKVEVPDNNLVPDDDNISEFYCGEAEDEAGSFSPETLAMIVMRERFGCDEDYGFDYSVEYETGKDLLERLSNLGDEK
jgi:hypothetical protein